MKRSRSLLGLALTLFSSGFREFVLDYKYQPSKTLSEDAYTFPADIGFLVIVIRELWLHRYLLQLHVTYNYSEKIHNQEEEGGFTLVIAEGQADFVSWAAASLHTYWQEK